MAVIYQRVLVSDTTVPDTVQG